MTNLSFDAEQRGLQGAWFTENLAPNHGYAGAAYRIPPDCQGLNLAPAIRKAAERLFSAAPVIQWHQHANHGLSSQVCCLNFLLPFAEKPELLRRWVEHVTADQVSEMLPIELDRAGRPWLVTFEWIGDADYLHEGKKGAPRKRGANATAADAAMLYRDVQGRRNLLLIEWKYTEHYGQPLTPRGNATRRQRYEHIFRQPKGPIRADAKVTLDDFFYEPFYQMLRQQMLAWHTEASDPQIDRARVLHLSPSGNRPLHRVTSPGLRRCGDDAFDVFRSLLVNPQDFVSMSIEEAFAPLAAWPEADWYPWLRKRYSSLWIENRGFRLMARPPKTSKSSKQVDALKHDAASRRNIPTAEMESFFRRDEDASPMPPKHYPRARPLAESKTRTAEEPRVPELIWNGARITITDDQMKELAETGTLTLSDAQLVWRGKDRQDWSDLVVNVPPLYIQEKIHPKAIIDDLKRRTAEKREAQSDAPDLFADFNGIGPDQRAEFYQHDQHWSNRMILGDSLQVMASLAERESLRGKVQCIYFDPPYGIKFNSNWQVSTQSRDVKDGKQADISREPEQVKAFRDTWKDGIHSYLTYLRDRLTAMRDLLTESGSIFVQIGDENMHRVRAVMDEVFGEGNCLSTIPFATTGGTTGDFLPSTFNYILQYAKKRESAKYRQLYLRKAYGGEGSSAYNRFEFIDGRRIGIVDARREGIDEADFSQGRIFRIDNLKSQSGGRAKGDGAACWVRVPFRGATFDPGSKATWKTHDVGIDRLLKASRCKSSHTNLYYVRYIDDFPAFPLSDQWTDTTTAGFASNKQYVVETSAKVMERCILMATDPGDLVLDPTCGSGTAAYVAEQWGRRWITIDTSRVALALARTRLMAARYPWYFLADSREGRAREADLQKRTLPDTPVRNDIRQGFVYERVPHITLKSIANNPLIDDMWEKWQAVIEPLRAALNQVTKNTWEEWQIPRELPAGAPAAAKEPHTKWWEGRIARQREIDASIAARADVEFLYDKPYIDNARVRVAGPFTVESLSPHRVLPASEEELIDLVEAEEGKRSAADADLAGQDFAAIVIDYLKSEGVKQQDKGDRITFESLTPWPGNFIGASGTFVEGENGPERRAAILIGPEYGTVGRQDIVAAAREAVDARFDVLIACAFNFDAHSSELGSLGSLKILKARINPDMHMSDELKNTGRGNMFVVFGEPDVEILDDGGPEIRVKVRGVFDPNTGDIRSNDTKGIAAWFIDTDYNEESFFVRHAYFLGANDPYKSLKTALQADIDEDAWTTLYSDTSRPFARPAGRRIAVKVINHFGDEVMKVFGV